MENHNSRKPIQSLDATLCATIKEIVITCLARYLLQGLIRRSCNVKKFHILNSYKKIV